MAKRYQGGSAVPGGYYLDVRRWAIVPVARDGDRLPPGTGEWRRLKAPVAVALVPILGVTFLMFMPFAGFVVLALHLAGKARGLFRREEKVTPAAPPGNGGRSAPEA